VCVLLGFNEFAGHRQILNYHIVVDVFLTIKTLKVTDNCIQGSNYEIYHIHIAASMNELCSFIVAIG